MVGKIDFYFININILNIIKNETRNHRYFRTCG